MPTRSKITLSAVVGADAPLAPPGVADQLLVSEVFQNPEPPSTQYLSAIYTTVQTEPEGTVTTMPEAMATGPPEMALLPVLIVEETEMVAEFSMYP